MSGQEARYAAQRQFGDQTLLQEVSLAARQKRYRVGLL